MLRNAAITGWGSYTPERVLTNQDLEKLVDTTDDWIVSRTGIHQRHIAGPGETTASMCVSASRRALHEAQLSARDLDLVICATTTPDHLLPSTGCLVQRQLGAEGAGAFDLNAACSGFLYALAVGNQFIQAGTCERVLVTAGETLSRFIDWEDRGTCILFGDGAAAVVLEATYQDTGVLSTVMGARGDTEHLLAIEAGGCARPCSAETVAAGDHHVRMHGNELFKLAVRCMAQAARTALDRAGLTLEQIRTVIPHQANGRIITATREALGLAEDRVFVNLQHHGNTGSTSVPIALTEFLARETVEVGDNLLLVAFGGGLTWAAAVVRWADLAALREREQPFGRLQMRPIRESA